MYNTEYHKRYWSVRGQSSHFSIGKKVILREFKINLAFKVDWISMNKGKGKEVSKEKREISKSFIFVMLFMYIGIP